VQFIIFYLSKFPSGESSDDMMEAFHIEINKYFNLLIYDVDLKADNAVNCLKEIWNKSLPKGYRKMVLVAVRLYLGMSICTNVIIGKSERHERDGTIAIDPVDQFVQKYEDLASYGRNYTFANDFILLI